MIYYFRNGVLSQKCEAEEKGSLYFWNLKVLFTSRGKTAYGYKFLDSMSWSVASQNLMNMHMILDNVNSETAKSIS